MDIKARLNSLAGKFDFDNKTLMLITIISSLLLYVNFSFIIKAQLAGIKEKERLTAQLKRDVDTFYKNLALMKDSESKNKKAKPQDLIKRKSIIAESEVPSLLKQIADLADNNKVLLLQIRPLRELSASGATPVEKVMPLLINLEAAGDYHKFGYFINSLENAPVFISVSEMKILPKEGDYLKQKISLVLRTYVKK